MLEGTRASEEEEMRPQAVESVEKALLVWAISFGLAVAMFAQEPSQPLQEQSNPVPQEPRTHPADGRQRADLPAEAYAVVPGTKFLVRLEDELDTKETHEKKRFRVQTLEPLEAGSGIYLPSGAELR